MTIVVNDACLIIDLIDVELFNEFLQLELQPHITLSIMAELEDDDYSEPLKENIKQGNLTLHTLSGDDQRNIEKLMQEHSSRLSEPDCSCLYLAQKINATILTCERLLTKTAKSLNIEVHGSLWVLDQLVEASIISQKTAHLKLIELTAKNNRLPKKECEKRLKQWSKA